MDRAGSGPSQMAIIGHTDITESTEMGPSQMAIIPIYIMSRFNFAAEY